MIIIKRKIFSILIYVVLAISPGALVAYDSHCGNDSITCADGYAKARTRWGVNEGGQFTRGAEHARIWLRSRELSGLPASLDDPISLEVFTSGEMIGGGGTASYETAIPVLNGASGTMQRITSLAEMTMLPDEAYNLWDWASGNELCPPDENQDPVFCHSYEFHMGPLNRNHMVPQSQRFYEHYHQLALDRAGACNTLYSNIPDEHKDRFTDYILACEKEAMLLEAIGHHFLQDAWSMGHTWEAWGGTELSDFDGNLTLGALIAMYVGTIHGAKSFMPFLEPSPGADDPMCAPHPHVVLSDPHLSVSSEPPQAAGDVFLDEILNDQLFQTQREAMLGCTVSGMRRVYGATAQLHGEMSSPHLGEIDASRSATDSSCWSHRATNLSLAKGFGLHVGHWPNQIPVIPGVGVSEVLTGLGDIASSALLRIIVADLLTHLQSYPPLDELTLTRFRNDASYAATLAAFKAVYPPTRFDNDLASGGLPPIAGIQTNAFYARGGASQPGVLPNSYADPFTPWNMDDPDLEMRQRKEILSLTFKDAHVGDRCDLFQSADLEEYKALASSSPSALEQCAQFIAPHLRHGLPDSFDTNREALCAFVTPNAAFVYTEEDPASFIGDEPRDIADNISTARQWCAGIKITITPSNVTVASGDTVQFSATVIGLSDTNVTWSTDGGSITSAGIYTAGSTLGDFSVTATSVADPTVSATTRVNIGDGTSTEDPRFSNVLWEGDVVERNLLTGEVRTCEQIAPDNPDTCIRFSFNPITYTDSTGNSITGNAEGLYVFSQTILGNIQVFDGNYSEDTFTGEHVGTATTRFTVRRAPPGCMVSMTWSEISPGEFQIQGTMPEGAFLSNGCIYRDGMPTRSSVFTLRPRGS